MLQPRANHGDKFVTVCSSSCATKGYPGMSVVQCWLTPEGQPRGLTANWQRVTGPVGLAELSDWWTPTNGLSPKKKAIFPFYLFSIFDNCWDCCRVLQVLLSVLPLFQPETPNPCERGFSVTVCALSVCARAAFVQRWVSFAKLQLFCFLWMLLNPLFPKWKMLELLLLLLLRTWAVFLRDFGHTHTNTFRLTTAVYHLGLSGINFILCQHG